jgi:SAM-dependent methyltransferase
VIKLTQKNSGELSWKRKDGNLIFGGFPVAHSGKELGLLLRLNMLKTFLRGKKILSVGCGFAAELKSFKMQGYTTIGLDPAKKFILKGKKSDNADNLIQAVGENIPFCDKCFDGILLLEVLEHVKYPESTLKEIGRVLKDEGVFLVTVPNRFYFLETHGIQLFQNRSIHFYGIGLPFFSIIPNFLRKRFERARIYTQAEVSVLLKKNGFEPIKIEYLMPPLDILKQNAIITAFQRFFLKLSKIPIIKMFGANIMLVCKKYSE